MTTMTRAESEGEDETMDELQPVRSVREVPCPDCHRECGWCSWYVKNARVAGCGSESRRKCQMAESLKGTTCPMCGGTERVTATTVYARAER